ncbi:hypothetical protein [Legionella saoudiensis]|uniref:hypothetical protein n=1 Tax=Legionella saoudiensis TaxID=1750561 RepID=UPI00072FBCBC|nr:hypothetical protein [Legionella saoudiensis]
MPHYRKQAALEFITQLSLLMQRDKLEPKEYTPNPQVTWDKILMALGQSEANTKNIYQRQSIFSIQVFSYFYQYALALLLAEKYLNLKDKNAIHKHSAERRELLQKHAHYLIEQFTPYKNNIAELSDFVLPRPLAENQKAINYEAKAATQLYKNYVQAYNKTSGSKLNGEVPTYYAWADITAGLEEAESTLLHNLYDKQPCAVFCYRYLQILSGAEKYIQDAKKNKQQRLAFIHEHLTFVIEKLPLIQAQVPALNQVAISSHTMIGTVMSASSSEKKPYTNMKLTPVLKRIEDYANFLKKDPRNHTFFGTSLQVTNKGKMLLDFVTDIHKASDLKEIKKILRDFDLQQDKYIHHKAIFALGQNATTRYFNSFMSNIGCATRLRTTTITLIDELRELVNEQDDMSLTSTRNTFN